MIGKPSASRAAILALNLALGIVLARRALGQAESVSHLDVLLPVPSLIRQVLPNPGITRSKYVRHVERLTCEQSLWQHTKAVTEKVAQHQRREVMGR